jgi:Ala-tRNA(Pro) deacylase
MTDPDSTGRTAMNVQKLLQESGAPFETTHHNLAYSANEVAAAIHVSGKQFAKGVLYKADGSYVLAVLPACMHVDEDKLAGAIHAHHVAMAPEQDLDRLFPDCEVGAMPPFGREYGVRMVVDGSLTHFDEIAFQSGTHTDVVKMRYKDYERIESPQVASFAAPGC